jgi:hypothetical protein
MAGRKPTFDTERALELLKKGLEYKEIAKELKVKENTLRVFYRRNAKEEIENRKKKNSEERASREYESKCHYVYRDRPLMPCESISTEAFIKMNRQSYIADKETGNLKFDKTRGGISRDLPLHYKLKY